jgi:hypothetical protein
VDKKMAITTAGRRVLREYITRVESTGKVEKLTIANAVRLTPKQQTDLQNLLVNMWDRPSYICPQNLAIKPKHGYESRVLRDKFSGEQYAEWLEQGCSDAALVEADEYGKRIHLAFGPMGDYPNITYKLVVPVHSDSNGSVHIDDVIPKGLPAGTTKQGSGSGRQS